MYSNNFYKRYKKIIKRGIGFLIPNIILLGYLLITNTLYEFIDYCFLGLSSFAKENILISIFLILKFMAIIYLIYNYHKKKDIELLYLLFFQIMAYPLFDLYHCVMCFIPVFGYFINNYKLNKKMVQITIFVFIITSVITNIGLISESKKYFQTEKSIYQYRTLIDEDTNKHIKK